MSRWLFTSHTYRFTVMVYVLLVAITSFASPLELVNTSIRRYLEKASVQDDGSLSGTEKEIEAFLQWLTANQQFVVTNFQTIAQTRRVEQLLLVGFEKLPADQYVSLLSQLADKVEKKEIAPNVLQSALSPKSWKFGFLMYNYQNPRIRTLLQRARELLMANRLSVSHVDSILTGDGLSDTKAWFFAEHRQEPELLP